MAKKPAKKPAKKQSDVSKWLSGDVTYQQQLAEFQRALAEYNAQTKRQTGMVNRDYAESQRSLNRQGAQDRVDQQNDFAGRGILKSGVYAKALGDYNTEFNQRVNALSTGRTDQLGDIKSQQTNYNRQLDLEKNNAKQDAIRRRAQKLGI